MQEAPAPDGNIGGRRDGGPSSPLVSFENITKRFGSTLALDSVSLTGEAGTVHAVTGENGAGKSTLMNLLAGVHQPDSGAICLRGSKIALASPAAARTAGISTIFQELTLLPNLTVSENMFLGREPRQKGGLLDHARMRRLAGAALNRLGSGISPDAYCGELSVGARQMVEIAKGIAADADVFILDEPTAALNSPEVEKLAALIGALRAEGKLIFYISHRLDEIFRFCDVVSILKDGAHVATTPVRDIDHERLVSLMVGRELGALYPERTARPLAPQPLLTVTDMVCEPAGPEVSLTLARGEIVGLAGLEGQGQRDIIRAIAGIAPPSRGRIVKFDVAGRGDVQVKPSIVATANAGIGFVPEDRKTEGLYLSLSIASNMALGMLRNQPIWRRAKTGRDEILALLQRMRVSTMNTGRILGDLSGGNQQKVMIGRWLAARVDVLLVEEPTRGVDVGAKAEIYALLRDFADAGGAVLITSSELTEVLGLCDRIVVVRGSALVAEFTDGKAATEEAVMNAAMTENAAAKKEAVA